MSDQPSVKETVNRLIADYRPLPGIPDEMMGPDGKVRPLWTGLIAALEKLGPAALAERCARGDRYLQEAGVFHRQYGAHDSVERDWPLSHVPVLMDEEEWSELALGLIQRADLLESLLADLYGQNRLVADRVLPPELVAQNIEWLRPLVGVAPRGGHFLHFVAFDLGRGPDGRWWVLGDRTQAPSGAGFALETRVATSRAFPDIFGPAPVLRLAGFFRHFHEALAELAGDSGSIAVLTPGNLTDTYYEHAYLARYLGLMLLEGEDLEIRNGRVMVRTVAGLKPVSVLWRRFDAAWADPLELNEGSRIGTPGLVGAIRSGGATMVNALGAGIVETHAFLAFLPRIAQALRGEPLSLPNIATWWCGQPAERDYVIANAARMVIGPALSTRLPYDFTHSHVSGDKLKPDEQHQIADWVNTEGGRLVGQEAVTLSTAPVLQDGRLVPRPVALRLYLARTPNGWQVMPGGFARVGASDDATALSLSQGGSVADLWVQRRAGPVDRSSLVGGDNARHYTPGALPSRAADNLFWLGRYVERAEFQMRFLRAWHVRLAESDSEDLPIMPHIRRFLKPRGVVPGGGVPAALDNSISAALGCAGRVRDRFSVDGWMALNDLRRTAQKMAERLEPGDDAASGMGILLRKITGFSGLMHENMTRSTGWHFLSVGRALERAMTMTDALDWFTHPSAPDGSLDLLIEVGDSEMTHRRRYSIASSRSTVLELLVRDPENPRSVLYQIQRITDHMRALPDSDLGPAPSTELGREVLRLQTDLATSTPDSLDSKALAAISARFAALTGLLSDRYLS